MCSCSFYSQTKLGLIFDSTLRELHPEAPKTDTIFDSRESLRNLSKAILSSEDSSDSRDGGSDRESNRPGSLCEGELDDDPLDPTHKWDDFCLAGLAIDISPKPGLTPSKSGLLSLVTGPSGVPMSQLDK